MLRARPSDAARRSGSSSAARSSSSVAPPTQQPFAAFMQLATSLCAAGVLWGAAAHPPAARAHVALQRPPLQQLQPPPSAYDRAGFDPGAAAAARAGRRSASSPAERQQSPVASEAARALQQLAAADAARAGSDWPAALSGYQQVVAEHPDLALTEFARLGQGLCEYQVGSASKALLLLEDQEVAMRGNPETHAALAAVLWAERPAQRLRAEEQFDIATEFDAHYADVAWVAANKHWPPRLLDALARFLALQQ